MDARGDQERGGGEGVDLGADAGGQVQPHQGAGREHRAAHPAEVDPVVAEHGEQRDRGADHGEGRGEVGGVVGGQGEGDHGHHPGGRLGEDPGDPDSG